MVLSSLDRIVIILNIKQTINWKQCRKATLRFATLLRRHAKMTRPEKRGQIIMNVELLS